MARRTKGVHIALIVFVVLCILLGVGVYLMYQKMDEASMALNKSIQTETSKEQEITSLRTDVDSLKLVIGCPASQRMDYIEAMFSQDLEKYTGPGSAIYSGVGAEEVAGESKLADEKADAKTDAEPNAANAEQPIAALTPENMVYNKLVEIFYKRLQAAKLKLSDNQNQIEQLKKPSFDRETQSDRKLTEIIENSKKSQVSLLKTTDSFFKTRSEIVEGKQKTYNEMFDLNVENETSTKTMHSKMQESRNQIKELGKVADELNSVRDRAQNKSFDKPDGIVLSSNLTTKSAIINLGSASNLRQQTEFEVFSRDVSSTTSGTPKGQLRVLRIIDANSAECLIVQDETNNPIQIGDKIFTSTWTPGEKVLYALVGKCDIDGDGKGDMDRLVNYVRMHGDEVVCFLDGTRQMGQIKPDIRYLVIGELPDEKDKAATDAYDKFHRLAKRYNIPEIKLPDLLNRIGVRERTATLQNEQKAAAGVGVKRDSDDRFRTRSGNRAMPR